MTWGCQPIVCPYIFWFIDLYIFIFTGCIHVWLIIMIIILLIIIIILIIYNRYIVYAYVFVHIIWNRQICRSSWCPSFLLGQSHHRFLPGWELAEVNDTVKEKVHGWLAFPLWLEWLIFLKQIGSMGRTLYLPTIFSIKKSQWNVSKYTTRWWFQIFFIYTPPWGNDPIWLIFFKWVETIN